MVAVATFALHDIMQQVQTEFQMPINSTSHTSPAMDMDLKLLHDCLEAQMIQEYNPTRSGNNDAVEVLNLIGAGLSYANQLLVFFHFIYKHQSC